MGKKIVPPHDPSRLHVIMDEKKRIMGVDVEQLNQQIEERRRTTLKAQRARHEQDEEWSTHWSYIESMYEKQQDCQRKRRYEYGIALKDQMEATKRQKKLTHGVAGGTDDAFMKHFGSSHR